MDIIDIGLYATYLLLAGSVLMAVAWPLMHAAKSPKSATKSIIALGSLVVLFGVSYALTGSEVTKTQAALGITETTSKMIGAGLTMFYLALLVAIIGMVYSEINKALK
jgi:hypothetical protein